MKRRCWGNRTHLSSPWDFLHPSQHFPRKAGRKKPALISWNMTKNRKKKRKEKLKTSPYYRNEFIIEINNITRGEKESFRLPKKYYHADMVDFLATSQHCGMLWSNSLPASGWVFLQSFHWNTGPTGWALDQHELQMGAEPTHRSPKAECPEHGSPSLNTIVISFLNFVTLAFSTPTLTCVPVSYTVSNTKASFLLWCLLRLE